MGGKVNDWSEANIIRGFFSRYGLFEITLPVCCGVIDMVMDYEYELCVYIPSVLDPGGILMGSTPFTNEAVTSKGDLDILINTSDNDEEKTLKLIIPIFKTVEELAEYCDKDNGLCQRSKEGIDKKLPYNFLVYVASEKGFYQCCLEPINFSGYGSCYYHYPVPLKEGFNYKLNCLGEYEWTK